MVILVSSDSRSIPGGDVGSKENADAVDADRLGPPGPGGAKRQRRAKKAATTIPPKRKEGAPATTGITPAGEPRIAGEPLQAAPSPTIDGMVDFKLTPYEVRLIQRRRAKKALEAASAPRGEGRVSGVTAQGPTIPRKRSAPVDAKLESEQSARVLRQRLSPATRSPPTGIDCPLGGSRPADDVVRAAPSPLPRGGTSGAEKWKRAPADDGSVPDLADLTDGESDSDPTELADLSDPEDPTSRHYAGAGFLASMGMTPKATEPAHPTKRVRLGPANYDRATHSPKPNARPAKPSLRRDVPAGPSEPPASDAPDDDLFAAADLDGDGCDSFAMRLLRAAQAAAGRAAPTGVRRLSSLQPGSPGLPLAASPLGMARAQPGQYRPRRASGLRLATDETGDSVLFLPRQAFVPAVYEAVRSRWTREAAEPTIAGYRARFAALLPRPK
ncbi:MAG: hypothetical protein M1826_006573 [Phylliscum demangeonii]|nr:MAG: hypothetical protein M1826_006573 [Phylliscum demangeonii]